MKYQVASIRYQDQILLHLKFSSPGLEQRVKSKEQRRAGISSDFQKTYHVKRIMYKSRVKAIYDAELGVKEAGYNSGKRVEEYLRYVNLGRGQPWCAAFICWVYGQAGVENPRSGWTPDLFKEKNVIWRRAESQQTYQVSSIRYQDEISLVPMSVHPTTNNQQPTTGDIFALFFPEKNRIAHAGFIDQWGKTWLITVEGNTNIEGSREGDGVYRKRRLVRSVYEVARHIREE